MDWATLQRRATFSASAVVLLAGAFVVYQFIAARVGVKPFDLTQRFGFTIEDSRHRVASPQSPVRVVGGSIRLLAPKGGWATTMNAMDCANAFAGFSAQKIQSCIVSADSVDFSSISLTAVGSWPPPPPAIITETWTSLGANWTITAFTRGTSNAKGVDICVIINSVCFTGNGDPGVTTAPIAIAVFDNSQSSSLAALTPETIESADTVGNRVRLWGYHDPNYQGAPANVNVASSLLQLMGQITVTVGGSPNNFTCFEGLCQIDIGN